MTETTYPVHEMFHTFQGEGVHMGRSAFFVRLFGCPVRCPWCDSAGTWHPTWVPKDVKRMTAEEIVRGIPDTVEFVVITGGEPAIFDLRELISGLHGRNLAAHLETSGAFSIIGHPDWITLSPKKWKPPIWESILKANELKFIIEFPEDIDYYWKLVFTPMVESPTVWLHPEWGHRNDPVVLNAISLAVKMGGSRYRAGWQLHKCYGVDFRDNRTRPPVPLGGEEARGY